MATAPFSLTTSSPANTDIAANFPALDRTDKDVIQSWITVQQNSYGANTHLRLVGVGVSGNGTYGTGLGSAPTASAGGMDLYYDTDYSLKQYSGDLGAIEYVGVPPGTILDYAGSSAPAGYILLTGTIASPQNVSRTTFARLFAALGTTWGTGDGSTTFGLPPANVFYAGSSNTNLGSFGATGGSITGTIAQANLPNVNFVISGITLNDPGHYHVFSTGIAYASGGANWNYGPAVNYVNQNSPTATTGITISNQGTAASGGSGTGFFPPYAVMNKIIKY